MPPHWQLTRHPLTHTVSVSKCPVCIVSVLVSGELLALFEDDGIDDVKRDRSLVSKSYRFPRTEITLFLGRAWLLPGRSCGVMYVSWGPLYPETPLCTPT